MEEKSMNAKTVKLSAVMIIFLFSMFLFSCEGSIEGQLALEETGGESTEVSLDEWPGDTLTITICIEDEDGEEVCTVVEIEDPGDTITFNFEDQRTGDYYMGIYSQEVTEGATAERELITWYHSDLDTLGPILDKGSSETISISFFHLNVNLGVIRIPY
jgi:hypothetical protein